MGSNPDRKIPAHLRSRVILSTGDGRYIWHPVLSVIDFIPKGKRTPADTINTRFDNLDPVEALRLALKREGIRLHPDAFRQTD